MADKPIPHNQRPEPARRKVNTGTGATSDPKTVGGKTQAPRTAGEKYNILYSQQAGVFLGVTDDKPNWSGVNPGQFESAPAFLEGSNQAQEAMDCCGEECEIPEHRGIEVIPDLPGNRVSKEALAKLNVPVWYITPKEDPKAQQRGPQRTSPTQDKSGAQVPKAQEPQKG